jgi:hypothetical protein
VDGREVSTIKIDNLEVMTEDLGRMNWYDAKKTCENLGDGWRLPRDEDELKILYQNKDKIGGFADDLYWSSREFVGTISWLRNFLDGLLYDSDYSDTNYVRAVRYI